MSKLTLNHAARIFITAIFVMALIAMTATPALSVGRQTRGGEMKEQGAASQGEGPGNIGDKNNSGEASMGENAESRGDGIQNYGPIEGRVGKNSPEGEALSVWLLQLFGY